MSELVTFEDPAKPQKLAEARLTLDTADTGAAPPLITAPLESSFESYSRSLQPVMVAGDSIKINENHMEEDEPYAFRYRDRDYIVTKTGDRIRLYELSD